MLNNIDVENHNTTLDQYALKEYNKLNYITNEQQYIANLLLKNMNKSNIFFMKIQV